MPEKYLRSYNRASGITSHFSFEKGTAAGTDYRVTADTAIIHATGEKLFVMVKDSCEALDAGDFLIINPFLPFSIVDHPEKPGQTYEMISFRATTDTWNRSTCFLFDAGRTHITSSDPVYNGFLRSFSDITDTAALLPGTDGDCSLSQLLQLHGRVELMAAVMTGELGWHEAASSLSAEWDVFELPLGYICANLGSDLSLDDICAQSELSPFYFSHKFKELFGITVMKYVNLLKLYKSVAMLIRSDTCISDIARECGFGSVATYCNVFKRVYTLTPLAVRRRKAVIS